jgi:hypothetical protein
LWTASGRFEASCEEQQAMPQARSPCNSTKPSSRLERENPFSTRESAQRLTKVASEQDF